MKRLCILVLSVAAIVGAVETTNHYTAKNKTVVVADGSDPMPFCRKVSTNCPQAK